MSDDPIEVVRDWVGSSPDDAALYAALARWDNEPLRAAQSILRRRLADLEAEYSSYGVIGDAYWSRGQAQIDGVRTRLSRLGAELGDPTDQAASALPTVTAVTIGLPDEMR